MKNATVLDIINIMEKLAPSGLAEKWDNPGLQIGDIHWPVRSVWIALDPTPPVVEAACESNIDMLITHHPLLIRPVNSVDLNTPYGKIVWLSLKNRMAIFSAHTNLDGVADGINDMLAEKLALQDIDMLEPNSSATDTPIDGPDFGLGRIGNLEKPMNLHAFAEFIKSRLGLAQVAVAGDKGLTIERVAVCSGSGSGLMAQFFASDAQVFVSGDLTYHGARDAEAMGLSLIDIGHFASEQIVCGSLSHKLEEETGNLGYDVRIQACDIEYDPFVTL